MFLAIAAALIAGPALAQIPDHPNCKQPRTSTQIELCRQLENLKRRQYQPEAEASTKENEASANSSVEGDQILRSATGQKPSSSAADGLCGGTSPRDTALRGFRIGMGRTEAYAAAKCALGPWRSYIVSRNRTAQYPEFEYSFAGYEVAPPGEHSLATCQQTQDQSLLDKQRYRQQARLPPAPNGRRIVCQPPTYNSEPYTYIALSFKNDRLFEVEFTRSYLQGASGYGLKSANVDIETFAESLGTILGVRFEKKADLIVTGNYGGYKNNVGTYTEIEWSGNHAPCNCKVVVTNDWKLTLKELSRSDEIRF